MTLAVEEHVHHWHPFGAGRGCGGCEAWEFWPMSRVEMIDALPTGLLQQPPHEQQDAVVAKVYESDLQLEVMGDLLELVSAGTPSWVELESMATRVIERVRAQS